jgi:hypothetical protein
MEGGQVGLCFVKEQNRKEYTIFTSEGRMMVMVIDEGRKPAATDQDR